MLMCEYTEPDSPWRPNDMKAAGAKLAFSSGGEAAIDEARVKQRLQAIRAAKLAWTDMWNPRKP